MSRWPKRARRSPITAPAAIAGPPTRGWPRLTGLSVRTVQRASTALRLLGVATEVMRGRQRTRAERFASWRVGDRGRGWASVWALHDSRIQQLSPHPGGSLLPSETSPKSVLTTRSRRQPPVAAPLRGAQPSTTKPSPWQTGGSSTSKARRGPGDTAPVRPGRGCSPEPAQHGWTPRDVNQLITDWIGTGHWIPEDPHKPIGLLGAILAAHGNLQERPRALDEARELAELAAARERVASSCAESDAHRAGPRGRPRRPVRSRPRGGAPGAGGDRRTRSPPAALTGRGHPVSVSPAVAAESMNELPCQQDPDRWFDRADRTHALAACLACPVRSWCARQALRDRASWGMWAGHLDRRQPCGRRAPSARDRGSRAADLSPAGRSPVAHQHPPHRIAPYPGHPTARQARRRGGDHRPVIGPLRDHGAGLRAGPRGDRQPDPRPVLAGIAGCGSRLRGLPKLSGCGRAHGAAAISPAGLPRRQPRDYSHRSVLLAPKPVDAFGFDGRSSAVLIGAAQRMRPEPPLRNVQVVCPPLRTLEASRRAPECGAAALLHCLNRFAGTRQRKCSARAPPSVG